MSQPGTFVSVLLLCTTASRSFSNIVGAISFKSLPRAFNKSYPRAIFFFPGNFAKHLHNPSQSLVFNLARNVPTKIKHHVIWKSIMSFEPVTVNMNFAPVPLCGRVNAC